jgi:serpin B
MTAQGARGTTLTELLDVLHVDGTTPQDASGLAAGLNAIDQALAARNGKAIGGDGKPTEVVLRTANSLWGQRDLAWQRGFLDVLARDFGTGMREVDYQTAAEPAREAINAWVSEQTRERIPELIARGVIDASTRLTLVNAIFLKAAWQYPFPKDFTRPGRFTRLDGSTVQTDLMSDTFGAGFTRGPGWVAADLPYADGRLAMAVIVPEAGRFAQVERGMDGAWLTALLAGFTQTQVQVSLPRWTTRSQLELSAVLGRLGMPTAFTDQADFSGMTTEEQLAISAVIHEGFIAVDEAGTEAAAATAVVMRATAAPAEPVSVVADRPFLYVIHDNADPALRTALFVGRVLDPDTAGS